MTILNRTAKPFTPSSSFLFNLAKNQSMRLFKKVFLCVLCFSLVEAQQLLNNEADGNPTSTTEERKTQPQLNTPSSSSPKAFVPAFAPTALPENEAQFKEPVICPDIEEFVPKQKKTSEPDAVPNTKPDDATQTLTVDELRQLLHDMNQQEKLAQEEEFDDRTLLDIFGEVAKEYLTQKMIPDTDVECRWDWRSFRCEPACECSFDFQWGDYHLGRSCRMREQALDQCMPMDPRDVLRDRPVAKRLVSLLTQTVDIAKDKSRAALRSVLTRSSNRWTRLQTRVCSDLWTLHQQVDACLPSSQIPRKSVPERILCGPIQFEVCDEDENDSIARRVFAEPSFE